MKKETLIKVCIREKTPFGYTEVSHCDLTKQELLHYKKLAYKHPEIDWATFPEEIKHIVFYSELNDPQGRTYYANIYLNGACHACTEEEFEKLYTKKPGQFTLAYHRGNK